MFWALQPSLPPTSLFSTMSPAPSRSSYAPPAPDDIVPNYICRQLPPPILPPKSRQPQLKNDTQHADQETHDIDPFSLWPSIIPLSLAPANGLPTTPLSAVFPLTSLSKIGGWLALLCLSSRPGGAHPGGMGNHSVGGSSGRIMSRLLRLLESVGVATAVGEVGA